MAIWSGLGTGSAIAAGTAAVVVLSVAGYFAWPDAETPVETPVEVVSEEPATDAVAAVPAVEAPETVEETSAEPIVEDPVETEAAEADVAALDPEPAAEAVPEVEVPAAIVPSFDVVRVDEFGGAVIAGVAGPSETVDVFLNGELLTSVVADRRGNFVALFDIPKSNDPQAVSLLAHNEAGVATPSAETAFVIAPPPEPVVEPEPVEVAEAAKVVEAIPEVKAAEVETPEPVVEEDVAAPSEEVLAEVPEPEPLIEPVIETDELPAALAELLEETMPEIEVVAEQAPEVPDAPEIAVEIVPVPEATPVVVADEITAPSSPPDPAPEAVVEPDPAPIVVEEVVVVPAPEPTPEPAPEVASVDPVNADVASSTPDALPTTAADESAPRAPASERPPAVIIASADSIKVVQPPSYGVNTPEVMTNVTIDLISYDAEGEVILAGRGSAEDHVRIYVNDRPIKTEGVSADGSWEVSLPEVDAGIYTLRVDEIDEAGKVTSRAETPFKREDPEVVVQSAQASTNDSSDGTSPIQNVTIQPGATLWALARENYGAGELYVQIFNANRDHIRDPDLIYPGQIFEIPE